MSDPINIKLTRKHREADDWATCTCCKREPIYVVNTITSGVSHFGSLCDNCIDAILAELIRQTRGVVSLTGPNPEETRLRNRVQELEEGIIRHREKVKTCGEEYKVPKADAELWSLIKPQEEDYNGTSSN